MHPAREAKTAGMSRGSFVHPYSTPLGQLGSTGAMCRVPEVRVPTLLLRPSCGFDQSTLWRPGRARIDEFWYGECEEKQKGSPANLLVLKIK